MGADRPDAWARDKRSRMERRAREWGDLVERASDILTPGVPVVAHLGFAANGGADENTTGWLSCSDRERAEALTLGRKPLGGDPRTGYGAVDSDDLHELGAWGVEGGHVPERVGAGDCAWVTGARSDGVRKVLDRAGVEGHEWHGAHEDQIAIGVWNLARHAFQTNRRGTPESYAAVLVLEGLARQLEGTGGQMILPRDAKSALADGKLDRDRLAELIAPLASKTTIELRSAAARLWGELFDEPLVRLVDDVFGE